MKRFEQQEQPILQKVSTKIKFPNRSGSSLESMTRFRRRDATQPFPDPLLEEPDDEDDEISKSTSATSSQSNPFEMRRRRRLKKQKDAVQKDKKKERKKQLVEEDVDPYDSDPGESYREHCMRIKGLNTKTCLAVPSFFRNKDLEGDTVMTEPPSPFSSELEDVLNQTPRSLPSNHVVRYSLRTSVGDGSAKQPEGASVMDRRELRPNNVQVNVSHWSATGARPYMEDRYVPPAILCIILLFLAGNSRLQFLPCFVVGM